MQSIHRHGLLSQALLMLGVVGLPPPPTREQFNAEALAETERVKVDLEAAGLGAVDAHLAAVAKGVTPSRHLRDFPTSPCVKRFGCPVQDACRASLGTGNAERVMREQADAGALVRRADAPVGLIPARATEAAE